MRCEGTVLRDWGRAVSRSKEIPATKLMEWTLLFAAGYGITEKIVNQRSQRFLQPLISANA